MKTLQKNNRKSVSDNLSKYCYLANTEGDNFIEITEWSNGEGIDIGINDRLLSLTHGQLSAINYLTKTLEYNFNCNHE